MNSLLLYLRTSLRIFGIRLREWNTKNKPNENKITYDLKSNSPIFARNCSEIGIRSTYTSARGNRGVLITYNRGTRYRCSNNELDPTVVCYKGFWGLLSPYKLIKQYSFCLLLINYET